MKNNYKRNLPEQIEQVPESNEQTLLVKFNNNNKTKKLNKELIESKIELIDQIYNTKSENQRQKLIENWPNQTIKQYALNNGVVHMKNNVYFVGNVSNNMIHGYGLMIYGPKRFYQGNFQNNYKHGEGIQYLPNGIYCGHYINNKPQGKGAFYWQNQQIYQGEFLAGLKHGSGMWTSKTEVFTGQWRANKPDGFGIIITQQSRYEGQVRMGVKHGQGKQLFKNEDTYEGSYVNGKPEGYGEYYWAKNNSNFKGNFKNGLRHGRGIWTQGGDRYQGQYLNDKKNGKGVFKWSSGNTYEGLYFDDLRHGEGEMRWSDGSWYKGQWKYGVQHGVGEMKDVGYPIRKGVFENNILVFQQNLTKKLKLEKIYRKTHITKAQQSKQPSRADILPENIESKPKNQKKQLQKQDEVSKKISSFVTRKQKLNSLVRLTRHSDVEKQSFYSVDFKSKESKQFDDMLKQKAKSTVKKHLQHDINIIQWSNIKNVDTSVINTRYTSAKIS